MSECLSLVGIRGDAVALDGQRITRLFYGLDVAHISADRAPNCQETWLTVEDADQPFVSFSPPAMFLRRQRQRASCSGTIGVLVHGGGILAFGRGFPPASGCRKFRGSVRVQRGAK